MNQQEISYLLVRATMNQQEISYLLVRATTTSVIRGEPRKI